MTLRPRCPVSTSITWRNGIRFLLRVTSASRIASWTSVPVSQAWNFHPNHHCSTINPASTNDIWRNEGELECTQSWASPEELAAPLPRTYWLRASKFARSFGIPKRPHDGETAEQRLRLRTSTIRTHWHPHSKERMGCFS